MVLLTTFDGARVNPDGTLLDALAAIDRGADGVALVIGDDGHLDGILTDGDIRRAIIAGALPADPLAPHVQRDFIGVGATEQRVDVIELMQALRISVVPIVDDRGRLIGLHRLHDVLGRRELSNWALVMAGGQGLRLRPLTETIPKPMLRVAGRPILERVVLHLVSHGITRIFIAVNYLSHVIEEHFHDGSRLGCRIEYLRESEPLGTAGALHLLPPPTQPLLVMNGDLITQADLSGMIYAHDRGGRLATIGVRRYIHTVPFGTVGHHGEEVIELREKPEIVLSVNSGIYVVSPDLVARVPAGPSSMPDLLQGAMDSGGHVGAFEVLDDWIDVGRREQLAVARGEA